MTIIRYYPDNCAVCGAEQKNQHVFIHTSYLPLLLQIYWEIIGADPTKCTVCGYVSNPISKSPGKVTKEWLQSEEYINNDGINFKSGYADLYYKEYKVELLNRRIEGAFIAIFTTCLFCFEEHDFENGAWCSYLALSLIDKLKKQKYIKNDTLKLMRAGLLRRTGQFNRLIKEFSDCTFEKVYYNRYLSVLLERSIQKNSANIPDEELYRVIHGHD